MKTRNPYVGPRAFEEEDCPHFFGRAVETRQLVSLVIARQVVLLYAPSGAGKTSLLRAGVIPDLKQDQEVKVLPMSRVGGDLPPDVDGSKVKNIYVFNTLLDLADEDTQPGDLMGRTLSEGLASYFVSQPDQWRTQPCLLIVDQFEELFTIHPGRYPERADFFFQLQNSLKDYSQLSLLLSMREDYIAQLDSYAAQLPDRLRTRFRLELLGEKAAHQAIQQPARQMEVDFTNAAAEKLVNDLRKVQVQQPDGTTAEQLGRHIEPVQLQVVCRRLWEQLSSDAEQIGETDVEAVGDVDTALADYYAERVKTIAQETGVRERAIREWFERQLITEQGMRGQVLRGPEQSQGLDNRAISPLVDAHLVRAEKRLNATWYELAHDRLIDPVRENNANWFQANLSMLQRQADLWQNQGRSSNLLLRDEALEKADRWAAKHENELTSVEGDFLKACREVRAIADARQAITQAKRERRKNHFIQALAVVAVIFSIVAGYFFFQARRSEKTAIKSERAAIKSEEAAIEAKKAAIKAKNESLTQSVAFQSLFQYQSRKDKRAALLSRQAYLFNQKYQVDILHQVDNTLRTVLPSHFSHILRGHKNPINAVAFSPDGQVLATGSVDNTVRLWDIGTSSTEPIILDRHEDTVTSVVFSPDGRTLASGSEDTTVCLWDVENSEKAPIVLRGHTGGVASIAFSPGGKTLASGSGDGDIQVWNLTESNTEPEILHGHDGAVYSVAFSPDGQTLASGGEDQSVRLWDLMNSYATLDILQGCESTVYSVAFSPDGLLLVSGSSDSMIRLWNLTNPSAKPVLLPGHERTVYSVAFSPDGQTLASGSEDQTVRLWDINNTSEFPIILRGHEGTVYSVAFSPDGQNLSSGSKDQTVRLWDLQSSGAKPAILRDHERTVYSIAFSPDGQMMASSTKNQTVLRDFIHPAPALHDSLEGARSVAFSSDSTLLALGCEDQTVRLWNLSNPDESPFILSGHTGVVYAVAFSPDSKILASSSGDQTIRLWDLSNLESEPKLLKSLGGHKDMVRAVAFSPDGRTLASGSGDKTIRLWDIRNLDAEPEKLEGHTEMVWSVAFSPDGKFLASGCLDKTVRLWDRTKSPVEPITLGWHDGAVYAVAFSPDGKTLASASGDKTIRLWNREDFSATPIILRGHEHGVTSVAFSPDGKTLASGSYDKTVRLWVLSTEILADVVCEMVWRNLTMEEWQQFVSRDLPYEQTCPNLPAGKEIPPELVSEAE